MWRLFLVSLCLGAALAAGWLATHARPQDTPWVPLDLAAPVGAFTGRKLTALTDDLAHCRVVLARAGVRYEILPAVRAGVCSYADAVRFASGGARMIRVAPATPLSCAVAATLAVWEWEVVQPAAARRLGTVVTRIDTFGSYACRRIAGTREGGWSEHATADAIDVAGFRLTDGRRITIARDWRGNGPETAFLHDVRDGACRLFATTLSPDYNAAHRDHLHLDQAARGAAGWRACR